MKAIKYTLEKPMQGICKQSGIWCQSETGGINPVMYFQKPKWISQESFDKIISKMTVCIPLDVELDHV